MINYLSKKIINFLVIIILGVQCFIYFFNQKPLTENFSQKTITVENFSSIVLSKSGITKIGSEKLNKIDNDTIILREQRV
jgi:GTP-dependent phosphoenolpyruvate carboxykinase